MTTSLDSRAPSVMILVATYNAEQHIERTLASLLAQSFGNFRCIVSDDASTDQTLAICQRMLSDDPRFELQVQCKNQGWLANTNHLLSQVTSDYFMIMPHDDEIRPNYLQQLLNALQNNSKTVVAYSDMLFIDSRQNTGVGSSLGCGNKPESTIHSQPLPPANTINARAQSVLLQNSEWWALFRGLVRTDLVQPTSLLQANLAGQYCADMTWALALSLRGEWARIAEPLYIKHYHGRNLSIQWVENQQYSLWAKFALNLALAKTILQSPIGTGDRMYLLWWMMYGKVRRLAARWLSRFHST